MSDLILDVRGLHKSFRLSAKQQNQQTHEKENSGKGNDKLKHMSLQLGPLFVSRRYFF